MKFARATYCRSEADLIGEFYFQARQAGLEVFLEVYLPSSIHRSGQFRVDAVVVQGEDIVCCVEGKRQFRTVNGDGRQVRAYSVLEREHRVPTVWINDIAGVPDVVRSIRELVDRFYSARNASPRAARVVQAHAAGVPS